MPREVLPRPCLMLVSDRRLAGSEDALVEAVAAAVTGGVNAVQLREKDLSYAALAHLAIRLGDTIAGRALLIVNTDHWATRDAAADGLHLPDDAALKRPDGIALIGRSVHALEAAVQAELDGADYVIAGPVYETTTHPGQPPAGLGLIAAITGAVRMPVVAIGGITATRVPDVIAAGADGVAVISAILGAASPERAARELREALAVVPVER
ncbi:MAG: thiamine phosphate synthase [Dehalococcoidia bacterium]